MDSEKCTIIMSILKNGSMSAAAEELNYTQSGISRAVEALERSAGFHESHPGITVELCSGTSTELSERMSAKSLDFGIVSRRGGTFESTVVKKDSLVAMLPPNHPLAQAKSVPATIFEREPYIEIHTGLQTDNTLCFRSRGIVPKLSFSTPDCIIACGMVKAGLGVALVNSVIADELRGGVAYVPLDPPENVDICVITPAREVISPAAKSFAAYAMGFISEL